MDALRSLLNNSLRISVVDGRIFVGSFQGTDKALNLLIVDTEEFRILKTHSKYPDISNWDGHIHDGMYLENSKGRYLGQVLIPWKQVVKVEAHGRFPADHEDSRRLYL